MTRVAGIDSSTQSCKVTICDSETGQTLRSGRAKHPEGTETDPELWWQALQTALAEAGGLEDVQAVSIAAQQHGMVALDQHGEVVRPALLWNDTKSGSSTQNLVNEIGEQDFIDRIGFLPLPSFTLTKLRWLRDHEPEHANKVAAVALPHDWLTWRLKGYGPADRSPLGPVLDELTTDRSDASGTAYWSPLTGEYDYNLLEVAFGAIPLLPKVLAAGSGNGTVHPQFASGNSSVLVAEGAGDNAAAALGLGAKIGDTVISLGTSGVAFAVQQKPTIDPTGVVSGFASADNAFLPLIASLNAAFVLDHAATITNTTRDELTAHALAAPSGAEGVTMVPFFAGERTPNLPNSTASIGGLTDGNTHPRNIARAAIEGMLCGIATGVDALAVMEHSVPSAKKRILLIGGAAKNEAVQAVAREIFEDPLEIPAPAEYVARGAAVQAARVLHGKSPEWSVDISLRLSPDPQPHIREQFTTLRNTLYPELAS